MSTLRISLGEAQAREVALALDRPQSGVGRNLHHVLPVPVRDDVVVVPVPPPHSAVTSAAVKPQMPGEEDQVRQRCGDLLAAPLSRSSRNIALNSGRPSSSLSPSG